LPLTVFAQLISPHRIAAVGDEKHPSLAEIYYEYGNALLLKVEASKGLFGDNLGGMLPAPPQRESALPQKRSHNVEASVVEGDEDDSEKEDGDAGDETPGEGDENADGGGAGDSSDEEGDTPAMPSPDEDLQTAFEVLDVARIICQRSEDNNRASTVPPEMTSSPSIAGCARVRLLSDVLARLADASMEADQPERAIDDLQSALALRQSHFPNGWRDIAEMSAVRMRPVRC